MKDKMRRFFDVVVAVKQRAALNYTAAMCIYVFFLWVFKQDGASLPMLFSLLVVGTAAGLMQVVAFSDVLFKKLAYGWRLVVFAIPFGAILTGFAVAFRWFPIENSGAWITFGVIFVAIFVLCTAGFELYVKLSGRKYDDKLDWYHKNRDRE